MLQTRSELYHFDKRTTAYNYVCTKNTVGQKIQLVKGPSDKKDSQTKGQFEKICPDDMGQLEKGHLDKKYSHTKIQLDKKVDKQMK